jgi:hypothetical protein
MRREHHAYVCDSIAKLFADRPTETVSEFCEENLIFDEPDNRGPYSLAGREYAREPLDSYADPTITDGVLVFGSQSGKTGILMGGAAYLAKVDPSRLLWVMASEGQAQTFAETRWLPMLRASPTMAELLPSGARRHDVKKLQQQIGASIVNFFGSNSPGNLASIPARVCVQDEVDKFDQGGKKEADAVNLADQRTKKFANPKRMKSSTPTLVDGLIWQEFLKTDQRRRLVPCPHCSKPVLFAWSKEFTVFALTGNEAWVKWDKEAKRGREWDFDRVERSARAECPHCGGHITDAHKTRIDRMGVWTPTSAAARGYRGWHLSSLYAASAQTTFGKLAVKFLQAKRSLLGLQGFINGDLAEPWENQDSRSERTEIIVRENVAPIAEDTGRILTVDYQQNAPYFWFVARDFAKNGDSRVVKAGSLEQWHQVRELQLDLKIADNHVGIDSGYDAQTVYKECLRWGKMVQLPNALPIWVGWTPMKGRDGNVVWTDKKTRQPMLYYRSRAPLSHKEFELSLLEFNGDALKDILAKLRKGPEHAAGIRWELIEDLPPEYFRHLDAEVKMEVPGPRGRLKSEWRPRSKRWPNHLLDCEIEQLAFAMFHKRLPWAVAPEEPKK